MNNTFPKLLTEGEKEAISPEPIREVRLLYTHPKSGVTVKWSWYNEKQGTVEWSFGNTDSKDHSFLLLRNGYYFAGAFWPVYFANSGGRGASGSNPGDNFGTNFLSGDTSVSPLQDNGVKHNNPPLGLITFGNSDPARVSDANSQVLFVFTLKPEEKWSMIEGGFSASMEPSNISLHEVTPLTEGDFCIGYDPKRVSDWDQQTGTSLAGYSPNPETIKTWLLEAETDSPFLELPYKDSYSDGNC